MKNSLKWKVAQRFEINWWQRYLKNKGTAAYATWKRQYWQNLLDKINDVLTLNSTDRILDAGCGPAGIFMVLENYAVDAVDPLLNEYESKLAHFKKSYYPHTSFFAQSFELFDSHHWYGTIFCMNAINHVADLTLCFDKLVSLTKPDGAIVVTIDGHNYSFFKKLFRLIPGDVLHPHQFDLKEYEEMLASRGCSIMKTIKLKHEFFFDHYIIVAKKLY